jgi:hypothetical protein
MKDLKHMNKCTTSTSKEQPIGFPQYDIGNEIWICISDSDKKQPRIQKGTIVALGINKEGDDWEYKIQACHNYFGCHGGEDEASGYIYMEQKNFDSYIFSFDEVKQLLT